MQSLTDRMAAALRDLMRNGSEADVTEAFVVLAEYDAARNPPPRSAPQRGQHVRILRHADWGDEAVVIRESQSLLDRRPAIVVETPDGNFHKLLPDEYQVILNPPATNTGD